MLMPSRVSLIDGLYSKEKPTTHLLGNHDDSRSPCGSSDSRNGEELDKPGKDIAGHLQARLMDQSLFLLQEAVDIVKIPGRLHRGISQPQE